MSPGKNILLVEGDPVGRAGLSAALCYFGLSVRCAACGREALDELRHHRPDVILLDPRTAEQDGWEFWRHPGPETDLGDVRVVVLSAPERADQLADSVRDVTRLQKPLDVEALLAAIGWDLPRH
jgi:CheY-like chemotaxis protein